MAINFPDSPTDGQTYTVGSRTWTYSLAKDAWLGGTSSVAVGSITGLGTGVATALQIAAGAAGGFVRTTDSAYIQGRTRKIFAGGNSGLRDTAVVSNGGAGSAPSGERFLIQSNTTANGTARYSYATGVINNAGFTYHNTTTIDARVMPWSRPTWLIVSIQPNNFNATTNGFVRCMLGMAGSPAANYTLNVRGIGFVINNAKQLFIIAHNGTTLTTSAAIATLAWTSVVIEEIMLYSDGAGNVAIYRAGVLLGTTTGGPTTETATVNQVGFMVEVGNGGDTADVSVNVAWHQVTVL